MDLIKEFIDRYSKEFDFYEKAGRMVADIIEGNLRSTGIRAIVTSRAKNPARLGDKIRQRWNEANYKCAQDIYNDIVDLSGVRIALYFPGESVKIEHLMRDLFSLEEEPKHFKGKREIDANSIYQKRFSGYLATHYRIRLKPDNLNDAQKRYTEAKVEVQVASVLMHAWSEVEHDLVYKPLQGELSYEEYAILDELNGLVLSGEISLERLQRAGEFRASTHDREYSNHYDLASSLVSFCRSAQKIDELNEATIGKVDILYKLIKKLNINSPDKLRKYIDALHDDFEKRPISEQIIDQILLEDKERYKLYNLIKFSEGFESIKISLKSEENKKAKEIKTFLDLWINFEKNVRKANTGTEIKNSGVTIPHLKAMGATTKQIAEAIYARNIRNDIVHGNKSHPKETIESATNILKELIENLNQEPSSPSKKT